MRINRVRIKSYKSFADTGWVTLGPGFNAVVGQNNSGKTAFLECLSPKHLKNYPYKALENDRPIQYPNSVITYDVSVSGEELSSSFFRAGGQQFVPVTASDPVAAEDEIRDLLKHGMESLQLSFKPEGRNWAYEEAPNTAIVDVLRDKSGWKLRGFGKSGTDIRARVVEILMGLIYGFKAERLNVSESDIGKVSMLLPNASNLAAVVIHLQTRERGRYDELNRLTSHVFPNIHAVTSVPTEGKTTLRVWTIDPSQRFEELAIDLEHCGTGVGQVIAMLCVLVSSDAPRVMVIDEPNSFLHPAAARAMLEIMRSYAHQYIISTHSAEIVSVANPSTLYLIRWDGAKSVLESLNAGELADVRRALTEVGVRLSEVFGADQILWVEGDTERECFPKLLVHAGVAVAPGISIVAVRSTGDFEGRKTAQLVWDVYTRLSNGNALLPAALGFSFDREERSAQEIAELEKRSRLVHFLPRRTYENYLIEPTAVAAVLTKELSRLIDEQIVKAWLIHNGGEPRFGAAKEWNGEVTNGEWLVRVNAPRLLGSLFSELSEAALEYRKPIHSVLLTEWLLANNPIHLQELTAYVRNLVQN